MAQPCRTCGVLEGQVFPQRARCEVRHALALPAADGGVEQGDGEANVCAASGAQVLPSWSAKGASTQTFGCCGLQASTFRAHLSMLQSCCTLEHGC